MVGLPSAINAAQEIAEEVSPAPVTFKRTSSAKDVKRRLDWGKPDLTIIDVRDRHSFNQERIMGAVLVSPDKLIATVNQIAETNRDLYIYGHTPEDTINAASQLDRAGFYRVAVLEGGLTAWKAVKGAVEGRST